MLIEYKNVDIFQDDMKVLEGVNFHVDDRARVHCSRPFTVSSTCIRNTARRLKCLDAGL